MVIGPVNRGGRNFPRRHAQISTAASPAKRLNSTALSGADPHIPSGGGGFLHTYTGRYAVIPGFRPCRVRQCCWQVPAIPAILSAMPDHRINLHLVSDATGETLNAIARATTVQFEHAEIVYHRWSLIRTRFQLHRVLEGIEHEPGPVLSTLVDRALRGELETTCRRLNVPVVNVLDPVMNLLQEYHRRGGRRPPRPAIRAERRLFPPHRRHALRAGARRRPGAAGPGRGGRGAGGRVAQLEDADLLLSRQPRHQGGQRAAGAEPAGAARAGDGGVPGGRPDPGRRGADRDPPPSAAADRRRQRRRPSPGRTAPSTSTRTR